MQDITTTDIKEQAGKVKSYAITSHILAGRGLLPGIVTSFYVSKMTPNIVRNYNEKMFTFGLKLTKTTIW